MVQNVTQRFLPGHLQSVFRTAVLNPPVLFHIGQGGEPEPGWAGLCCHDDRAAACGHLQERYDFDFMIYFY